MISRPVAPNGPAEADAKRSIPPESSMGRSLQGAAEKNAETREFPLLP